jgi:hypothetical protein
MHLLITVISFEYKNVIFDIVFLTNAFSSNILCLYEILHSS